MGEHRRVLRSAAEVHLRDGRVIRVFALDRSMVAFGDARRIVSERVAELNERLTDRGGRRAYLS